MSRRSLRLFNPRGLSRNGLIKGASLSARTLWERAGIVSIVGTGLTEHVSCSGAIKLDAGVSMSLELQSASATDQIGRFDLMVTTGA